MAQCIVYVVMCVVYGVALFFLRGRKPPGLELDCLSRAHGELIF